MVKTHLPAHMDSVRQKCRPKHQLLILKCYPRLPKNSAADVKPNGSELSYLLYYASTRRSKLQKVGSFLERKTASDVHRWQSARVLVTLQILTALLENKAVGAGSGFALIAPYVLKIVREILQNTNDISLIEASLATWEVFCKHQDQATLKADHEYRELYEDVVDRYAALAWKGSGKKLGKSTQAVAVQDAIRLREAGLGAMKSILLSDALASESGRQLDVVVPAMLSNMRGGEDEHYLQQLLRMSKRNEEDEKDKAIARRQSMATVRTYTGLTDISAETDPRQAGGTAQDADAFAEEEVAVSALECLKAVFESENRSQVRSATSAVLRYMADLLPYQGTSTNQGVLSEKGVSNGVPGTNTWATKLFELCTAWTPVQDRFILMVCVVETLVRLPLQEADLSQHLLYTELIDHILRSDLNLIGLSIMDILLGLIQQILRVLQLNGPRVGGRSSAAQLFSGDEEHRHPSSATNAQPPVTSDAIPSEARVRLTERLKHCISDLATHVYYTDQISDMLSAILLRLKPSPPTVPGQTQNPLATAAAIEEPRNAVSDVASNVSLLARERSNGMSSGFFSFDTARRIALEAVKDVLQVANSSRSMSIGGGVAESRNKVPIDTWEGTQWLLRDPAADVRCAYVDALCTWLQLETKKSDFRIKEPKVKERKKDGVLARRAVSNASQKKDKQERKATITFLQLLHLAVFENALQFALTLAGDGDREILLLHLLLTTLMQKLGVNAVQSGLPMIFALQEECLKTDAQSGKTRIGSLVHGYFWSMAEVFDFDVSSAGQEIFNEIKKRRDAGLWVRELSVPAKGMEQISAYTSSPTAASEEMPSSQLVKPFEDRQALVDRVADYYRMAVTSPSPSAPGSPGRSPGRSPTMTMTIDRNASNYLSAKQSPESAGTALPDKVKEAMMEQWTKEGCLAAIAASAPKSVSLSGSRSSPSHALAAGNHRQLLAAANAGPAPQRNSSLPTNIRQQAFGPLLNSQSQSPDRRPSASTRADSASSAGVRGTVRVDDLKRVLAGGAWRTGLVGRFGDRVEDTASESLVDVGEEDLGSEASGVFSTPPQDQTELARVSETKPENGPAPVPVQSVVSGEPTKLTLPSDAFTDGRLPSDPSSSIEKDHTTVANGGPPTLQESSVMSQKAPPSRGGASVRSKKGGHSRKDLNALLAGIGPDASSDGKERKEFGGMGRPPY